MIPFVLLLALACHDPKTETGAPSDTGEIPLPSLRTSADGILDAEGRQLLLKGINMPTWSYTAADYELVTSWGLDTVRQLYLWSELEPTEGTYDEAYLAGLDTQVELASQYGVHMILDHHQHAYGEGFTWGMPDWTCDAKYYEMCAHDPGNYFCEGIQICFELFWNSTELRQMYVDQMVLLAARYADNPTVIGFDVMNEPWCGHLPMDECGAVLGGFYTQVATAIHEVAPDKLIFYEPNYIELAGFRTELTDLDFDLGVYAAHFYVMDVHNGKDYDLDPETIELNIGLRAEEAVDMDVPLFVGEFGGMAGVAHFDQYIDDHLDIFDSLEAGSAYWLYAMGDGFHILDKEGNEKDFVDHFVRPYPKATPGQITSLAYEQESRMMTLSFQVDKPVVAPGILFVPDRHFPDGFTLEGCDAPACTWEAMGSQEVDFHIGEVGSYTLVLRP